MATITRQSWTGSGAVIKLGEHTHQNASVQSGAGPILPPPQQMGLVGVQIVFSASLHVEPNVCVCVFDNYPHLLPS